jgi:hypothetical protein
VSAARIHDFSQENVNQFFSILEPEMANIKFSPNRIFNVDETGITIEQHKSSKVVGPKGKRQVASLSSAERGTLIMVVTCMSASGQFVPPLLLFPRKNVKSELLDGPPPGTIGTCHTSGWIQTQSFTQWFTHFIYIVKPTADDPLVLVLDCHYSHTITTRNVDVIEMARSNSVVIVCLPSHSTHKMQPHYVAFMNPFKIYYAQEIEMWL